LLVFQLLYQTLDQMGPMIHEKLKVKHQNGRFRKERLFHPVLLMMLINDYGLKSFKTSVKVTMCLPQNLKLFFSILGHV
jgi:hypothetical protein